MHELAWQCAKRFVLPSARSKYEQGHDVVKSHKEIIHAPDLAEEEKEKERNVDGDADTNTCRMREITDMDEKPYDIVICPSYGYKVIIAFSILVDWMSCRFIVRSSASLFSVSSSLISHSLFHTLLSHLPLSLLLFLFLLHSLPSLPLLFSSPFTSPPPLSLLFSLPPYLGPCIGE